MFRCVHACVCVCVPVAREYVLAFMSTGQVGAGRKQGWLSRMPLVIAAEERGVDTESRGGVRGSKVKTAGSSGDRVRARRARRWALRGCCISAWLPGYKASL
jgi:hypothetical protein